MGTIEQELMELDAIWGDIVVEDRNFDPLPDGRYQVEVTEARVEHAKNSGRLQFTMVMVVLSPSDLAGKSIVKCSGLDNEQSLSFVKSDLKTLQVETEKISGLPLITTMLIGNFIEVALVSKKKGDETYQNVYINRLLQKPGEEDIYDNPDNMPF